MGDSIRVLIVDDDAGAAARVETALRDSGLDVAVRQAATEDALLAALEPPPDVVVAAALLPNLDPITVMRHLLARGLEAPVVVVAGRGAEDLALECLRCGAADYVRADDLGRLGQAVRQSVEKSWLLAEARAAEAAVRESRSYFATIFQNAPVALAIVDGDRRVLAANAAAAAIARNGGQPLEGSVIGDALRCLNALSEADGCGFSPACPACPLRAAVLATLADGQARTRVECVIPVGAAPPLTLLVSTAALDSPAGRRVIVAMEDISAWRATERQLASINRLLLTVREVHRLVAQERSREWLLGETCHALATHDEFSAAWAGLVNRRTGEVAAVAVAGTDAAVFEGLDIRCDDASARRCPVATAVREARSVIVGDLETAAPSAAFVEAVRTHGARSAMVLPLKVGGEVVAVLAILSHDPEAFQGQALDVLEGLAADLSVALEATVERERRRRMEAALVESERNYREIFDSVNEAIFIDDAATGRILDVNATMLRMYGFESKEEVLNGDVGDLSAGEPPFDQATARELVRRAAEGQPQTFEWVAKRKNGETFWAEVSLRGTSIGGQGRVLAVVRDITDRKSAERALRESEARFRGLFQNAPVGVYRTTPDGHIVAANPALIRMLGYTSFDELATRNLSSNGFPADGSPRGEFQASMLRDGRVSGLESAWLTKDGRTIWVREHATAVRGEHGEIVFYDGIVEDITERKAAEDAVRESEQRYRAFFEEDLTADYIAQADGTLLDCNPAYLRLFGFGSRAEALATPIHSLFANPADRDQLLEMLRSQRTLELVPLNLRRVDGTPLHALANIAGRFASDGTFLGTKGYLFDITEMKHLEEQLRHAQKMEAVGRLAGGVAHDFNNLLQAMLSYITLLKGVANDPTRVAAGLEELERSVRRGASLTRQLLTFSRRGPVVMETFDVADFLRQSETFFRHLLRENIALDLAVADVPLPIVGDRRQLEQVLMNLIVNAADAMPEGGALSIRCAPTQGAQVLLEVADTGCGMSQEVRERIFEPFFTTKGEGAGTGLGLAVVHGIVGQHNGRIEVESEPGRGTTFRIFLPRVGSGEQPTVTEKPETSPLLLEGQGERILVVEDDEVARESLREILAAFGYTVETVGSSAAALALPADEPFALLLTDYLLPDGRGTGIAAALRQRWPELRVLLMSGYAEDAVLRDDIERGAVAYLQKPFDMETLAREVRTALSRPLR